MRNLLINLMLVVFAVSLSQPGLCAQPPQELEKKGFESLVLSQTEPDAIVSAALFYGQASAAYVVANNEEKAVAMNSFLYWCKKKMTSAQMDTFLNKGESGAVEAVKSFKALDTVVPVSEAKEYFDRAEKFAKKYPQDFLPVAVRYFEVADRFPDSVEGRNAMQLSLAAMQKVALNAKVSNYAPAATDGKIFIQSDPPGASIVFVQDGAKRDTGKKTPSVVQLPRGPQSLELELKGFKTGSMTAVVEEKAIAKPDPLKLNPLTALVDIIFEADWQVFVDGTGSPTKTPCAVDIPLGAHTVNLAKEGFRDIVEKITLKDVARTTLEVKSKPAAGTSAILKAFEERKKQELKEFCGKWHYARTGFAMVMEIRADGTYGNANGDKRMTGKWRFEGDMLLMDWNLDWGPIRVKKVDKNNYVGNGESLKR